MSKVNHDLRSNDGKTIFLPPEIAGTDGQGNLKIPNVYSESATQLYPIGTKFVDGERVFHYAYAGGALGATRGQVGYIVRTASAVPSYDASQAAGAGTVANPLKINGSSAGTPAKNAYAGQFIVIFSNTLGNVTHRIISNSISAYDSVYTTQYTTELVLDQPTPVAVEANTNCDIFPSRYADVRTPNDLTAGMYPFLGVPLRLITALRYFWIQTWGPCFITHNTADEIGDNQHWRAVVFYSDGTLKALHEMTALSDSGQIAGYTLATNGSGSEWTMLMLDR